MTLVTRMNSDFARTVDMPVDSQLERGETLVTHNTAASAVDVQGDNHVWIRQAEQA